MNAQGTQSRAPVPVGCTALHSHRHHTHAHMRAMHMHTWAPHPCTYVHICRHHTHAHMCTHMGTTPMHMCAHMRAPHLCAHTCAHARARHPEFRNAVLLEAVHEPSRQQPEQGFGVPPPGHHGVSFTSSRCPMWPDSPLMVFAWVSVLWPVAQKTPKVPRASMTPDTSQRCPFPGRAGPAPSDQHPKPNTVTNQGQMNGHPVETPRGLNAGGRGRFRQPPATGRTRRLELGNPRHAPTQSTG